MPSDLLSLPLSLDDDRQPISLEGQLVPLDVAHRDVLAQLYLASYPPGVGAEDVAEAQAEIAATFASEFGVLRSDASWLAMSSGAPAGAILVVERSIWDENLGGPFVIDLFVHPEMRGRGLGRALVLGAVEACRKAGDDTLSLRIGEGTSASAHSLYDHFGFTLIDSE